MKTKVFLHLFLAVVVLGLVGCETTRSKGSYGKKRDTWDRTRSFDSSADSSTPGWWYARREYNPDYAHWGKMRHLDGSAKEEKFILLNEDQCKAPHRSSGGASSDNHREYRFFGYFMAERAYEPASDELCSVFVLQKWQPLSAPVNEQETVVSNPPPAPEVEEQAAPKPAQAAQASPPPSAKPKPKATASSTNAVVKAKAKPAAKPVVKKTAPVPAAQ